MWKDQATQKKARKLSLLRVGWVIAMGIVLLPGVSLAAEDSALDALQAYWRAKAPWCPFHRSSDDVAKQPVLMEFASKNYDGNDSVTAPCNDGNSIMFNGLLCLAGVNVEPREDKPPVGKGKAAREVGCDVVKHSQTLSKEIR